MSQVQTFGISNHVAVIPLQKMGVVVKVCDGADDGLYHVRLAEPGNREVVSSWDELMLAGASYDIIINEEQRVALHKLLDALGPLGDDHALQYWADMLQDLPNDEMASPGVRHGFCL